MSINSMRLVNMHKMIFASLAIAAVVKINLCTLYFDGTNLTHTNGSNVINMFDGMPGAKQSYLRHDNTFNKDGAVVLTKKQGKYRTLYVPGVGAGRLNLNKDEQAYQATTGAGIEKNILIGYKYLVEVCEKDFGVNYELRLIGFSRGAIMSRMISNYLAKYGISAENLKPNGKSTFLETTIMNPKIASKVGRKIKISFLGLYDSVAAIGTPGEKSRILDPDHRANYDLPGEENLAKMPIRIPNIVFTCAHAVAINENKTIFQQNPIFIPYDKTKIWQEVLFVGTHADIAGYKNNVRQTIALDWMVRSGMSDVLNSLQLDDSKIRRLTESKITESNHDWVSTHTGNSERLYLDFNNVHFTVKSLADSIKVKVTELIHSKVIRRAIE